MEMCLDLIRLSDSQFDMIFSYRRSFLLLAIERLQKSVSGRNKKNYNNLDMMFSDWIQKNLE